MAPRSLNCRKVRKLDAAEEDVDRRLGGDVNFFESMPPSELAVYAVVMEGRKIIHSVGELFPATEAKDDE